MAIENYFIYNSFNSKTNDIYVSGAKTFRTAERDYEKIEIPGRNGFLLQDNGRFKPVAVEYEAFCVNDAITHYRDFVGKLSSNFGLHKLTDTFDATHYRKGIFAGGIEPNIYALTTARFTLKFLCQPERWLTSGDTKVTYTQSGTLNNDSRYTAKPLIRVYGNGTFSFDNQQVTVAGNTGYIDIDTEMGDAYEKISGIIYNRNERITATDHELPVLTQGTNVITLGTGITSIEITPRWWEL